MCEMFPHIYIEGFLFTLAIFAAKLHAVCQPQCNANSWQYHCEFTLCSVCQGLYLTLSYFVTDIECSTTWLEQP